MPAAAVPLITTAASAYMAKRASDKADQQRGQAQGMMGQAGGLYSGQRDRAMGLIGNSDQQMSNILNRDQGSNPMFFAADKARFMQDQATAQRGLSANLARNGLTGSGLGAAASAGLQYRGATEIGNILDKNQRLWMDAQSNFSNRMNGAANQATAGQAGVLQGQAGMLQQDARFSDQAAQQGWQGAANSFGSAVSGIANWYAKRQTPGEMTPGASNAGATQPTTMGGPTPTAGLSSSVAPNSWGSVMPDPFKLGPAPSFATTPRR